MSKRKRSQSTLLAGAKKGQRLSDSKMFDHFFVIGADPSESGDVRGDPKLLFQYPPSPPLEHGELWHFCLPAGLGASRLRKSPSQTSINSLIYCQLAELEGPNNSFIFVLGAGVKVLYGICVMRTELIDNLPSYCDTELPRAPPVVEPDGSTTIHSAYRCYCILSQFPFFEAHFSVLYNLMAADRLYCLQTFTVPETPPIASPSVSRRTSPTSSSPPPPPFYLSPSSIPPIEIPEASIQPIGQFHPADHLVSMMQANTSQGVHLQSNQSVGSPPFETPYDDEPKTPKPKPKKPLLKIQVPKPYSAISPPTSPQSVDLSRILETMLYHPVLELIVAWWCSKVPKEESAVNIILPSSVLGAPLSLQIPAATETEMIALYCFPPLFRSVSIENLLTFYTACLLEIPVLVVSRKPGLLSAAVLSVIPLIHPLVWQGPLITILPEKFLECLEAPVPFVAGLKHLGTKLDSWNDPLIFDLDTDHITFPKRNLEKLPDLAELKMDLKPLYNIIHGSNVSRSDSSGDLLRKCADNEVVAIRQIMQRIARNNHKMFENSGIDGLHTTSRMDDSCLTGEDIENLVRRQSKSSGPFWRQLFNTQQFMVYAEKIKSEAVEQSGASHTLMTRLDHLLLEAEKEKEAIQARILHEQKLMSECIDRIETLHIARNRLIETLQPTSPSSSSSHRSSPSYILLEAQVSPSHDTHLSTSCPPTSSYASLSSSSPSAFSTSSSSSSSATPSPPSKSGRGFLRASTSGSIIVRGSKETESPKPAVSSSPPPIGAIASTLSKFSLKHKRSRSLFLRIGDSF